MDLVVCRGRLDRTEAVDQTARMRLRPILMTSFAFILGVVPLATATGAGSAAQRAIGIGVMGGMIAATALGILFVPLFYVVVMNVVGWRAAKATGELVADPTM